MNIFDPGSKECVADLLSDTAAEPGSSGTGADEEPSAGASAGASAGSGGHNPVGGKGKRFDLVLSLEVAEHISSENVPALVRFLAGLTGRFLVFSASRPGQEGTGHVNTMPTGSWIHAFEEQGLELEVGLTEVRKHVFLSK
jgi:hypothetical protein